MERIANTLLPARMFVVIVLLFILEKELLVIRIMRPPDKLRVTINKLKAKSKYHLFGGFYCVELEAVWNGVITEWNTAVDVGIIHINSIKRHSIIITSIREHHI